MQFLINLLSILLIFFAIEQILAFEKEEFEAARLVCLERHDISEKEYDEKMELKSMEGLEMKHKCFLNCLAGEFGFLDENEKLNIEKLKNEGEARPDEIEKIVECANEHADEEDPCEYSAKMLKCIMEKVVE